MIKGFQCSRAVKAKQIISLLSISWLLMSCQNQPTATGKSPVVPTARVSAASINPLSQFEPVDCWFQIPENADVICGYIRVPENHTQPISEKNTIRLAVAVFHSKSDSPAPDPIVYHVGGPGGHMLGIVPYQFYKKVIEPFLKERDLILLDPRGTGFSQPALECKQGEEAGNCVRRLFAEGHNLYFYNSRNMAADLQDLRRALGYDSWNLLGESYGTHVAQVALREAPEGLRSVILDAVVPIVRPELPDGKSEFELSLNRLFIHCQQDSACNRAYPDLQDKLERAIQGLNQQPVTLSFDMNGKTQTVILTGDGLLNRTMIAMYEAELIPYLPYAISAAADGSNYDFWSYTVKWENNLGFILSQGAHWAILCADEQIHSCDDWPVAIDKQVIASEIPALVLNGEFDPVTPPEYGYSVASGLSHSYVFDFPGIGQWVNGTGHPCQIAMIQDFLKDPNHTPDSSCIAKLDQSFFFIKPEGSIFNR